jgi:hypothetical protein
MILGCCQNSMSNPEAGAIANPNCNFPTGEEGHRSATVRETPGKQVFDNETCGDKLGSNSP